MSTPWSSLHVAGASASATGWIGKAQLPPPPPPTYVAPCSKDWAVSPLGRMIPALRACALSALICVSEGAPGATWPPLDAAAAGSASAGPTLPATSRLASFAAGAVGGSGSDLDRKGGVLGKRGELPG